MGFLNEEGLNKYQQALGPSLVRTVTAEEYEKMTEEQKQGLWAVSGLRENYVTQRIDEYDTEDGWHVRKWSSGYVEMSKLVKGIRTAFVEWGNGIQTAQLVSPLKLPVSLSVKYYENAQIIDGENTVGWCMVDVNVISDDPLMYTSAYKVVRPGNNPGPVDASVFVIGRWK